MDEKEYRKRLIEFTSLKNVIKFIALIKLYDVRNLDEIANKMGVDSEFLKRWNFDNRGWVNEVLAGYKEEIAQEVERLKKEKEKL